MERFIGQDTAPRSEQGNVGPVSRPTRIIDLSVPLQRSSYDAGEVKIATTNHRRGGNILGLMARLPHYRFTFRNLCSTAAHLLGIRAIGARDFPGGYGLAWETLKISTHMGTHMDAPWHYGPLCAGLPAKRIDEIPLEWCYGNGVVLDLRHRLRDPDIALADLRHALAHRRHTLAPGDIVLIMTGADRFWGTSEYLEIGPAVHPEAIAWLVGEGIRVIGTDAFSFDRSFRAMYREYRKSRDPRVLWPSHVAGRTHEYCQIEKLRGLDRIPSGLPFTVACFPIRIEGASAGWVRAVAIMRNEE